MKKLGIMGWWKGKNEGDAYIKKCLQTVFEGEFDLSFIPIPRFGLRWFLRKINKLDFLIVGGGGLFIPEGPPIPFDTYLDWQHKLKVPFGFLGIGVQEIRQELYYTYKTILEDCVFFSVRDEKSRDLLRQFSSDILVAPDLTFLYPRTIPLGKQDKIGVNLRVWKFDGKRNYNNFEWCKAINDIPNTKKTIPLSFLKNIDDREAMANIIGGKNKKFDMELFDVHAMIGMRLHSIIFAAQNFIPSIGIAYTPKVRRLLRAMGMEEYCLDLNEYDKLEETYSNLMKNSSYISKRCLDYTHRARKEVWKNIETVKVMIK